MNQADPLGLASLGAWIGGGLGASLVIVVAVATPFSLPVVGTIFLAAAIGSALDSPGDDPLGTVTDAIEVTATLESGTRYTAGIAPIMLTRPGGSLGPPTGGGGGALPPGGGVPIYRGVSAEQDAQLRGNGGVMQPGPDVLDLYVTPHPDYAGAYGRPWTTTVPPDTFVAADDFWGLHRGTPAHEIGLPYEVRGEFGGLFDPFFQGWRPL